MVEYDDSFERFLLLNDISQRTTLITENLQGYLLDKESSYLKVYNIEKSKLRNDQ